MRDGPIPLPVIAGTRLALGAGLGLLLDDRLGTTPRRAIGLTLLAVVSVSTVPLAIDVLGKLRTARA
jgi:F0F1-type ATP synthase assembly protein I